MAEYAIMIVSFALALGFGIFMLRWQFRAAKARVRSWVEQSGFELLELNGANPPGTGPLQRNGNKQVMYRVLVSTPDGKRRALVKVGSHGMGVLSSHFAVEWEDTTK